MIETNKRMKQIIRTKKIYCASKMCLRRMYRIVIMPSMTKNCIYIIYIYTYICSMNKLSVM